MEKAILLGDTHHPFHDKQTIRLVLKFLKDWEPDNIFLMGDIVDCYAISRFDKNPKRANRLESEFRQAHKFLKDLRDNAPNSEITFLEGNHEARFVKYLWRKAPELASFKSLTIPELLNLDELDIIYKEYGEGIDYGHIYLTHGDLVSKHSGWTAKAHYEKHGGSGACGHSHRGGTYYKTKRGDTKVWAETFCLCDFDAAREYVKNPDWCQGFSLVYSIRDRFFFQQVPIVDRRFVVDGKYIYDNKKAT